MANNDLIIDEILAKLYHTYGANVGLRPIDLIPGSKIERSRMETIIHDCIESGFIVTHGITLIITKKGHDIIDKYGSYSKYTDTLVASDEALNYRKQLEEAALESQIRTNRITNRNSIVALIISIVSIAIAVIALFKK